MPLLFSYGTLQEEAVQRATFGRVLAGEKDALPGHELAYLPIEDPQRAAEAGRTYNLNARRAGRASRLVEGTVFEVTDAELAKADGYEQIDGYTRISETLKSGKQAWLYVDGRVAGAGIPPPTR